MNKLMAALALCAAACVAQVNTASIGGLVTDPTGASVPGADIQVTNTATGQMIKTATNDKGEFTAASMPAATYRVTVSRAGFKTATLDSVELNAGIPAMVNVKLEIGQTTEVVEVVGGAEIVQTTNAAVSNVIAGRLLFELPFATRNAVELLVTQPGVQTPTNPRSSSINGLPRGALNVTIDGMNTQDNLLKSSDGFFSYIYTSVDALDELSMTTSAGNADSSGQGAAQIKFITKSGSNQYHGGAFYQVRNTFFNANYYFNNRDGAARDVVKMQQRGLHASGPIWKDKAFFFVNYEQYKLPGTKSYTRQVFTDDARAGNYTWVAGGVKRTVNLLTLAGQSGYLSTVDPVLAKTFADIAATRSKGIVNSRESSNNDYNKVDLTYQPTGNQSRHFLTTKLDYNLSTNHHLSLIYNYNKYDSTPDFLNNIVAAFPGTGMVLGSDVQGGQRSNRFAGSISLRSQLGSRLTNEWRGGLNSGTVLFRDQLGPGMFASWKGYIPTFGFGLSGVTTTSTSSRRNSPVKDIADNVYFFKGSHQIAIGGTFTQINSWQLSATNDVLPGITFGVATGDPVNTGSTGIFTVANFSNASATQLSDAAAMYAALTGRISSISKQITLDEKTKQYAQVPQIDRNRMREYGAYAQDTWRARRNLTISLGLRWEKEGAFENLSGLYSRIGLDGLYGVSGIGNLFQPGTLTGVPPVFKPIAGDAYAIPAVWAPSASVAWQVPKMDGILGKIFGSHEGASVLRAGYAISTVREGQNLFISIWGSNQGIFQTTSMSFGTTPSDWGPAGSRLLRNDLPVKSGVLASPSFPIPASLTTALNDFAPNLKLGYVQSWNIGWQRELSRNTVVEARYTGNHGVHLWRQYNLNEVNVVENGFLREFQIAQNNLRIARGGDVSRNTTITNFGNQGMAGQQAIPIIQTAIGSACGSAGCSDTTFANYLVNNQAGTAAATGIANNATRMANLTNAKYPVNMFYVNPTVGSSGSFIVNNDGSSYYDALQVELRRRLSAGVSMQGSYVFSKSLANGATNSSSSFTQPATLRNLGIDKVPSGFDIRHGFKANWIYEMPFGHGKRFLGSVQNPFFKKAIEGWETASVVRVQSATPFFLSGFTTLNAFTTTGAAASTNGISTISGISLHNITSKELQDSVGIRKTTGADGKGIVYFLPQELINNSLAAFQQGGKTLADLDPNKPYIGPAPAGALGWRGYLYPNWNRFFDVSLVKRTRIKENANVEFRATALNVFNLTNFNAYANTGATFGQVTGAYRDISGTVEPGGRILEFVLRVNF